MPGTPPTSPGPMPYKPARLNYRILLGMAIHAAVMAPTCFIVPLAMDSNIWPIAGVFWSVLTIPVAVVIGALVGWMVKKRSQAVAITVMLCTAIALAIVAGVIMANNR